VYAGYLATALLLGLQHLRYCMLVNWQPTVRLSVSTVSHLEMCDLWYSEK